MTEEKTQASDKQIALIQKLGLHPRPWELSGKEAWEMVNAHFNSDEKPKVPVVRPGIPEKKAQSGSNKEFHLSPEQVNTNALMAAIEWKKSSDDDRPLLDVADTFKEFIENGN